METSKHPRVLGLTASPGSEASKIKEICKNLAIEEVELRTRDSPDVAPYLQELEIERVVLEFPEKFQKMREARKRFKNAVEQEAMQLKDERALKITEYEKFINENLKRDLQKVLDYRDKLYEQLAK